ncbi:MAG: histidinol phosphatase [Micrococcales bacterium]|nr:histidinol phosphatase [Micrococcales bacterium]
MTEHSPADDLAVALTLAAEADLVSLDRYRAADLDVSLKADRTHVTDADRRVESVLREHLARVRPGDAILGEEFGALGDSRRQWILDPIDGTANFLRGVPNWGTLIALAVDGVPLVGVVSAPALGRRWWAATGGGAWLQEGTDREAGHPAPRRLRVSSVDELAEASVSYQSFQGWDREGRGEQLSALNRAVWRTRAYGDVWGHMLVAEGALDAAAEFDVKPWDIAPIAPIIREAGGRFTSADGEDDITSGSILVSNGTLHERMLELIR